MTYLAGPYSHVEEAIREQRYQQHMRHLAFLLNAGLVIYSPIVHNHVVANTHILPTGWAFWRSFDTAILSRCDKVIVLKLDGWDKSEGVAAEIVCANLHQIPIEYHDEY